ncbi:FHA domain-containing protein [Cryobacterium sp. MDB1-18-2]|uniref:FHA domain-containing protein n=1 Tax=unclassified Cryobacterium TaxID=2649013 RepID=UPI00106AEBCB|nr:MULTISPECIES: FHA domain-containing protein [unclassified Cryobacterium]TFC27708.1 FHA domain-containing protein [Cryobacterium sp. MDB1-18-2]TFC39182.1 FHA domain-containing protein [Cryobacterium sp. MDB1-18-1]
MDPEWMFVAGRSFVAAVPTDAPRGLVTALSSRAGDASVSAEALVGLLPLGGSDALESFALVIRAAADESAVTVVVRGQIAVDVFSVGGSRRFTDQGIRPWNLADFSAVTVVVIGSPDTAAPAAVPAGSGTGNEQGTVVGRTARWSPGGLAAETDDTAMRLPNDTVIRRPDDTVIRGADDTVIRGADDTVIRRAGDTVIRGAGDTVIRQLEDTEDTEDTATGAALRPPLARFRLSDGREFPLDRPYRLGRRPAQPRIPVGPGITLVAVVSAGSLVSATHVDIRQVGDVIVVTDAGSRNGTIVVSADGRRERLRPGDSRTVPPGTRIDIGDDNIIEIIPASGTESAPYFPAHRGRHHP